LDLALGIGFGFPGAWPIKLGIWKRVAVLRGCSCIVCLPRLPSQTPLHWCRPGLLQAEPCSSSSSSFSCSFPPRRQVWVLSRDTAGSVISHVVPTRRDPPDSGGARVDRLMPHRPDSRHVHRHQRRFSFGCATRLSPVRECDSDHSCQTDML
jgi:hypothetical protein